MNNPPKNQKNSLKITLIPLTDLRASRHNARKHSRKQVAKLAESIRSFGWTNPIQVDAEGSIIAGHGRVAAAKLLGLKSVPSIVFEHLSADQKRVLMPLDNRLSEFAEWDEDALARELAELKALDLDFDLEVMAFDLDVPDLSFEAEEENQGQSQAADTPKGPVNKKPKKKRKAREKPVSVSVYRRPISIPGDVWNLGAHRLFCGRALRDNGVCLGLMQGEKAQMAFTSLPINAQIERSSELGAVKRLTLEGINGPLRADQLTGHLVDSLSLQFTYCDPNAPQFLHASAIVLNEVLEACRYLYPIDEVREFGGELLFIAGPELESFTCPPGESGILVEIAVTDRKAVAPRQLAKDVILEASKAGDLVLDVYGSDGATLMACQETDRCARVIELSGTKVDAVIQHWQELTGLEAHLEQSGQTFGEVSRLRAIQPKDLNPYHDPVLEEMLFQQKGDAPCLRPRA